MQKPDKSLNLPNKFLGQYKKNILIRTAASIVLIAVGVLLSTLLDFSQSKYPQAGMIFVILIPFVLSCLLFRLDLILFKPSWMGVITTITAKKERRVKVQAQSNLRNRLIVHLTVYSDGDIIDYELWHEGTEHSGERTEDGAREAIPENKFYTLAPFKEGDTVVYLRGMKYPFRYNVKTEGMFDVLFVCPYCGEINKSEREDCYHCGRTLVK